MNERRFKIAHLSGIVTALAKIGILVDGAGDQAGDLLMVGAEDEGKGSSKGSGRLHGRESEFGNVIAISKAKGAFNLIDGCSFAEKANISIEGGPVTTIDEVRVNEDECLFDVEANGNNVHGILDGEFMTVLKGKFLGVKEFFVICQHYYERDVKNVLQISDEVSKELWRLVNTLFAALHTL
jgi:hypothetical protein